jgi:hypothetical protein
MHIKPTAYLIASMIVIGVFVIGGVVVVWTQSAPIRCATLLKRASFREEREVRIVAIPGAPGYQEQGAREYPDQFVKKADPGHPRQAEMHITLFEGVDVKLPIKRVIVGPPEHQAENAEFARSIVDCEVALSRPRETAI